MRTKQFLFFALFCFVGMALFAAEGDDLTEDRYAPIIEWLGNLHPIILHFPIALIVMTVISELLFYWYGNPLFDNASRFMIIAAAVTAVPTALLGLAYSYNMQYDETLIIYFWLHRFFGIFSALLAIVTAVLREMEKKKAYYYCLALLFISVNFAGYLGGVLTFGFGKL